MSASASPEHSGAGEPSSTVPDMDAPAGALPSKADDDAASKPQHPESTDGRAEKEQAEEGQVDEGDDVASEPPLPSEPAPNGPPLPNEPPPRTEDDGWDCQWDAASQAWFFHNRFTGKTQWDNPRVQSSAEPAASSAAPQLAQNEPPEPVVAGYNPAIHGDYDPNAWYAQKYNTEDEHATAAAAAAAAAAVPSMEDGAYGTTAAFNRATGQLQTEDMGPSRHGDEAKSRRQMNAFFDVDAAANADDGRSLKAERANKRISKSELKAFKERRRAKKEEKRRAWLKD